MWDFEGKKAVPWVISELLAKDQNFFKKHPLGKDIFLTFRIPNPEIEKTEAKLVPEILASIPRCYDTTQTVYEKEIPPTNDTDSWLYLGFNHRRSQQYASYPFTPPGFYLRLLLFMAVGTPVRLFAIYGVHTRHRSDVEG